MTQEEINDIKGAFIREPTIYDTMRAFRRILMDDTRKSEHAETSAKLAELKARQFTEDNAPKGWDRGI